MFKVMASAFTVAWGLGLSTPRYANALVHLLRSSAASGSSHPSSAKSSWEECFRSAIGRDGHKEAWHALFTAGLGDLLACRASEVSPFRTPQSSKGMSPSLAPHLRMVAPMPRAYSQMDSLALFAVRGAVAERSVLYGALARALSEAETGDGGLATGGAASRRAASTASAAYTTASGAEPGSDPTARLFRAAFRDIKRAYGGWARETLASDPHAPSSFSRDSSSGGPKGLPSAAQVADCVLRSAYAMAVTLASRSGSGSSEEGSLHLAALRLVPVCWAAQLGQAPWRPLSGQARTLQSKVLSPLLAGLGCKWMQEGSAAQAIAVGTGVKAATALALLTASKGTQSAKNASSPRCTAALPLVETTLDHALGSSLSVDPVSMAAKAFELSVIEDAHGELADGTMDTRSGQRRVVDGRRWLGSLFLLWRLMDHAE